MMYLLHHQGRYSEYQDLDRRDSEFVLKGDSAPMPMVLALRLFEHINSGCRIGDIRATFKLEISIEASTFALLKIRREKFENAETSKPKELPKSWIKRLFGV